VAVKVFMTDLNSTGQSAAEPVVTMATISKLERLACLQLAEADRPALVGDLAKILSYARSLTQLDLSAFASAVEGTTPVNVWRLDEVAASSTVEQALANAPEVSGPYYHVPRVLE
jgi:aspartyl/glutamyl-tRNA(Asn/Gln) amidotransferase C subunit